MLMHATMAALAVFICFAGNYLTGQSMMERPLVVGLVTGILMGDMKTGILMGASLEAVFFRKCKYWRSDSSRASNGHNFSYNFRHHF